MENIGWGNGCYKKVKGEVELFGYVECLVEKMSDVGGMVKMGYVDDVMKC